MLDMYGSKRRLVKRVIVVEIYLLTEEENEGAHTHVCTYACPFARIAFVSFPSSLL